MRSEEKWQALRSWRVVALNGLLRADKAFILLQFEMETSSERPSAAVEEEKEEQQPSSSAPAAPAPRRGPGSFLIAHSVAKRHNVGTIARCATAFGVQEVRSAGRMQGGCMTACMELHGDAANMHRPFHADVPGRLQELQHVWLAWR
jgi:hypothetical protein